HGQGIQRPKRRGRAKWRGGCDRAEITFEIHDVLSELFFRPQSVASTDNGALPATACLHDKLHGGLNRGFVGPCQWVEVHQTYFRKLFDLGAAGDEYLLYDAFAGRVQLVLCRLRRRLVALEFIERAELWRRDSINVAVA